MEEKAISKWARYITLVCDLDTSTVEYVPGARDKIVFDPYHIMSYMSEAVDEVRKREHREYRARGDETLARSRYLYGCTPRSVCRTNTRNASRRYGR